MAITNIVQTESSWERVMAAERRACSAMRCYEREVLVPLYEAYDAGRATTSDVLDAEEGWQFYTGAFADAVDLVIRTDAPDLPAALAKIDLAFAGYVCDGSDGAERLALLLANELRRLGEVTRS